MKRNEIAKATTTPTGPETLQELGVPGPLAAEFEAIFRAMGKVRDGHVVGHTFVTPDGVSHTLRVAGEQRSEPEFDRAA